MQNELKEAAVNNAEKESKIEELQSKNDELETKINDLENERKNILRILGLTQDGEDQNKEEEEEISITDSPIYWKIHEMKEKADSLQSEVENLQKQQQQMSLTIQQLTTERQSIMQALYGNDDEDDLNNSELMDNLNSLNKSISQQNEKINAAIVEEPKSPSSISSLSPPTSPSRRNRMQRPQNHVLLALKKIRSDLKAATESNCDKDIRIEELENQLRELTGGQITNTINRNVPINQNNEQIPEVVNRNVPINQNNEQITEIEQRIAELEQQILQLQSEKKVS